MVILTLLVVDETINSDFLRGFYGDFINLNEEGVLAIKMQIENFFIDEAILAFLKAIFGETIVTNLGTGLLLISKLVIFVIVMAIIIIVWNIIVRQLRRRITPSAWASIKTLGRFGMLLVGFGLLSFLFPDLQGLFIGAGAILGTAIGFACINRWGGIRFVITQYLIHWGGIISPNMS